jgi:hypothetical protein
MSSQKQSQHASAETLRSLTDIAARYDLKARILASKTRRLVQKCAELNSPSGIMSPDAKVRYDHFFKLLTDCMTLTKKVYTEMGTISDYAQRYKHAADVKGQLAIATQLIIYFKTLGSTVEGTDSIVRELADHEVELRGIDNLLGSPSLAEHIRPDVDSAQEATDAIHAFAQKMGQPQNASFKLASQRMLPPVSVPTRRALAE